MDSKVVPYVKKADKASPSILGALASAVREWVLIVLLFVEACFSYLVTKFAHHSHLQTPCLLCSRLDHVLGKERSEFYWDLICHNHKSQISSLVLCCLHSKLADVHGMCENCLFSFATVNKSNSETYRLLVGKLLAGPHIGLDGDSLLGDSSIGSGTKSCSCCNEQCMPRTYAPQLFQTKPIEFQGIGLDLHLPLFENSGVDDEHKLSRDETYRAGKVSPSSLSNFNPLPHVKYEKVKLTSDSESESPVSENEPASFLLEEYGKKDLAFQSMQPEAGVGTSIEDPVREIFIHPAPETELSHLESEVKFEVNNTKFAEEAVHDHVPEVEKKNDASAMPELISFREKYPSSPRDIGDAIDVQIETLKVMEETEVETEEVKDSAENCNIASQSTSISSKEQTHSEPDIGGKSLQMLDSFELGDAYKLAVISRGRQLTSKLFDQRSLSGKLLEHRSLSGKLLEQMSFKESSRGSEDFKLLLSQLSLARGIDLSSMDMSPRVPKNLGELKASDASTSAGIQVLQRRISLERNESNISLDGSTVSEIEGETTIDRLKRQVEHDKKLMCALYKELEEERNASAISANQAMAMITRLQEEKAALHMEALQCLRMMDEQVEYDEEGLENAMNLLTEKEKVVHDLEFKLQLYTKKYGPLSIEEDTEESFTSSHLEELGVKDMDAGHVESSTRVLSDPESSQKDTFDRVDE
ncbi:hypothetical protein Leryth_017337 [Lithospermum erythrorhizon]|nr:hypothetical protein Leryth_017337 [Lithospermum erythrorhizon]